MSKLAQPLSIVLSDAVLTKREHRVKASEVIGIYCDSATKHNVVKYFNESHHIHPDPSITIEELINITAHPIYWNDEYSLKVHFSGGDFPEQYFNNKTGEWE